MRQLLQLGEPEAVIPRRLGREQFGEFTREAIAYTADDGGQIPAFLFMPRGDDVVGGVVAFHQHNSEFYLGKSEVAGLAGDRWQAFGPALAAQGVAVLAPDAITFEDRRITGKGTSAHERDWIEHYNAMAYRLINGDHLMRKCLDDAERALTVLLGIERMDPGRVGVVGHSFGGTTALYHAALDRRCRFACVSGALCSFEKRQQLGTGIGMLELLPGIARWLDIADLVRAILPRPLMVVSATEDRFSADADEILAKLGDAPSVTHHRTSGEHPLDAERFAVIVRWVREQAQLRRSPGSTDAPAGFAGSR